MFRIRTSFSGCSSDTSISGEGGLSNTPEPVSCSSASSCQKTCRAESAIGGRDITRSRAPLHSQPRDYHHRSMARVATALLARSSGRAPRTRARPQRGLLAALGIAAATAMLAATIAGGRVSSELSVQRALAGVPIDQRAMRVLWSGAPAGGYRAGDPPATQALAQLAPGLAVRTGLYRETRFENSHIAVVTGVNDIGRWVTLTSGRLPRSCMPSRCEVVQVAGAPMPVAAAGPTRLVRVGTGRLASALPFGSLTDVGVSAGHRTPPATLVSGDVERVSQLPGLAPIYRTYSWTRPIDPDRVHSWDIGSLLGREARALTGLSSGFSQWSISAPDQALIDATDRSDTAGARLTLVGGEVATLLLAFVVLAANALRGDAGAGRRRPERRGGGPGPGRGVSPGAGGRGAPPRGAGGGPR